MLPVPKPTARQPRKWTLEEDRKLREEVEAQRSEGEVKDWCRIAAKLPGRTNKDCRKRWLNSVAGGLKKGQWSKSEDIQLARGVEQYGQRWTVSRTLHGEAQSHFIDTDEIQLVAELVGSRSADQCAKRWQQSLDPELDRSEWRESEDQLLIEAVQRLGRHWKDIQERHFRGRSKNCIKNRYTVIMRRYQNAGITLPGSTGGSEPGTPSHRFSAYSAQDEEPLHYPENMYDDLLTTHTQVSTPDTHHSWSMDEEPFGNWSSPQPFGMAPTAPTTDFRFAQQLHTPVTVAAHWGWTTTSMEPGSIIPMASPTAFPPGFAHQTPTYGANPVGQGTVAQVRSPQSSHPAANYRTVSYSMRGPTSSPGLVNAIPYHDSTPMSRMEGEHRYRY
ncbi:uncharacterized protein EI97DRAFT_169574 [Westerdykella ornata]|uniref:Uncharacterized protein n=1 Tax=Westerdykella ornata TaxID=318751 RepID=A0A6A6JVY9_WESOR|nr:uncharacterized protein EI97DRAFT_169574 [Westerdykella ornata]KAF2279219.1 hypothetical protein EI97DRAFT_169574 [Westerdykella ornata]